MAWKIVRLWIELTSAIAVLKLFKTCHSLADAGYVLQETDEVQRMGLIVAVVILVTGIGEMLEALGLAEVWERFIAWLRRRWGGRV